MNINHGPYCNVTSDTGMQEVVTVSYVVHLLNKHEFIPGFSLGKLIYIYIYTYIHIHLSDYNYLINLIKV